MRVVLDIDDELLSEMQLAAEIKGKTLNDLLSELFVTYIREPNKVIYNAYEDENEDFELFNKLLVKYLSETIENLEESAALGDAVDRRMIEVFKLIRSNTVTHNHIIADLYKVFKAPTTT